MPTGPRSSLPPRWALLVIDMQNDFLDKGGYYARRAELQDRMDWAGLSAERKHGLLREPARPRAVGPRSVETEQVIAKVRAAIAAARRAGRPIAFVRAEYDRGFDLLPPMLARDPDRMDFPCRRGSWGAEFVSGIADAIGEGSRTGERVVEKHTYDAFTNPSLPAFLKDAAVDAVVVCGTETQVCVLASAQHAALLGFRAFILEDGVWSPDAATARSGLAIFRDAYGDTVRVEDLG